jgi:hypothetical protein
MTPHRLKQLVDKMMKSEEAKKAYEEFKGDGTQPPGFSFRRFCEVRILDLSGPDAFPLKAVRPTPPAARD